MNLTTELPKTLPDHTQLPEAERQRAERAEEENARLCERLQALESQSETCD